jgi:WD40 repeat protein
LTPFSTSDAARFVGRETEVDSFVNRLRQRPLQVVVGPSGAGKTSFIHAGVLPALPASWRTVTLRPGSAPLAALASRLATASLPVGDLRPALESAPSTAATLVAQTVTTGTLVIVIDHLEELFTLCANATERVQFAAAVAELSASTDAPIRVIGAIRDDFLMDLDALAPLRALLSPAVVLLGNPTRDALVRIVVEPARRAGYALSDPELASDMVSVVADRPGALALLSFTAARLWELRDRRFRQLTRNAYDAMGGIGGALGRHAEETLDLLSADDQRLAREIFRHLVTAEGTRALVTGKELRQRLATSRADAVIDKLVAARLLAVADSSGEAHVEVIHDALIEAWPRLQQWVREDIDDARMRDQLRIAARQWQERNRSHSLLWRDDVLADLERWLRRPGARALSDLETAFVTASRRYARRAVRGRRALVTIAVAFVILFVALQYHSLQNDVAHRLAEARITQIYVEQGRHALLDGKHTEALLYLAEAVRRGENSPSLRFMLERAAEPMAAEVLRLKGTSTRMWWGVFSRDGRRVVTSDDKAAQVWEAQSGKLLFTLPHSASVFQALYSSDEKWIITIGGDGFVRIWDASTGEPVRALKQPMAGASTIYRAGDISPDGNLIAAMDRTTSVTHVWNSSTGAVVAELPSTAMGAVAVAFSHDGRWLAITGGDEVRVLDTRTWKQVVTPATTRVHSMSFDPTSSLLLTGTSLGDVSIWALPGGERVQHLQQIGDPIERVVFSPDGAYVAAASGEALIVWKAASGQLHARYSNHRRSVLSMEFDRTSKRLVSGGADGRVVISDVETGMPIFTFEGAGNAVVNVRFDATSQRVIGASFDGIAHIWDIPSPYRLSASKEIGRECGATVSLDADSRFVAVSCGKQGTRVWDTAVVRMIAELPGIPQVEGAFNTPSPALSSDGELAAIANGDNVSLYGLPGGRLLQTVKHSAPVTTVRFANDSHTLVTGSTDGALLVTRDGSAARSLPASSAAIDVAMLLPDGRVVATDARARLTIFSAQNEIVAVLPLPTRVQALRLSPDGQRFITIPTPLVPSPPMLWALQPPHIVAKLEGHNSQVFSAKFVRDGHAILTAGTDGTAKLWDGTTGRLRQTYLGATSYLLDGAVSPDGTMVVAASADGTLRFWDTMSGASLWALRAHKSMINGVHFEGDAIVTRGFTGEIARWRVSKPSSLRDLLQKVRRLIGCIPLRFDEGTGGLVAQESTCDSALRLQP